MPNVGMAGTGPPPPHYLLSWRHRGVQLANAIATRDPAFKEKLEAAKARRKEVLKRLHFIQKPRPDLMERFDTFDGIVIARRGLDARRGE